jgi:hypothetical protein
MSMPSSQEVNKQIRESLGLPAKQESQPTVPVEGHVCDFPIWSYSKRRCSVTSLHIDYEDETYFTLKAPEGIPGPNFPGYLDSILYYGQHDLFDKNFVEISVYSIFKALNIDPNDGRSYQHFRIDMEKSFAITLKTNRFIDPKTGQRSSVDYFRILQRMRLSQYRQGISTFYFDDLFLASFRSGYLKRLDFEYCLHLDRDNKPLSRFLYGHILKRLGEKSIYTRKLSGFLHDVGLGYIAVLPTKARNQKTKQVLFSALNGLRGKAFTQWETDDRDNVFFVS